MASTLKYCLIVMSYEFNLLQLFIGLQPALRNYTADYYAHFEPPFNYLQTYFCLASPHYANFKVMWYHYYFENGEHAVSRFIFNHHDFEIIFIELNLYYSQRLQYHYKHQQVD